jgi:hypothetical protein
MANSPSVQRVGFVYQHGFFHDLARIRRVGLTAFTGHAGAALAAQLVALSEIGVILTHPADTEAFRTVGFHAERR